MNFEHYDLAICMVDVWESCIHMEIHIIYKIPQLYSSKHVACFDKKLFLIGIEELLGFRS